MRKEEGEERLKGGRIEKPDAEENEEEDGGEKQDVATDNAGDANCDKGREEEEGEEGEGTEAE